MITKKLEDIEIADIRQLVDNNVIEKKTLEYKSELPGDSDGAKKEFLADVSSFANTLGGDLIFGVSEIDEELGEEIGFSIGKPDSEISRLENIIRDGISPRIEVDIRPLDVEGEKKILIIRIKASLNTPHRVIFKGHDKFYRRNSNGKYPIDVDELRTAFLQSSSLIEKIRNFRKERIFGIKAGETPIPISDSSAFMAIHILPLSSFSSPSYLDRDVVKALDEGRHASIFTPVSRGGGWSHRINLDGVVAYCGGDPQKPTFTYTQLYRNGIIEGVESSISDSGAEKILPTYWIENKTMKYVTQMIKLITEFGFQPPFYVFLTLTSVEGFKVREPQRMISINKYSIKVKDLFLPEVVIEKLDYNTGKKFRPVFDMIWNAGGISRSLNFDEDDNFKQNI